MKSSYQQESYDHYKKNILTWIHLNETIQIWIAVLCRYHFLWGFKINFPRKTYYLTNSRCTLLPMSNCQKIIVIAWNDGINCMEWRDFSNLTQLIFCLVCLTDTAIVACMMTKYEAVSCYFLNTLRQIIFSRSWQCYHKYIYIRTFHCGNSCMSRNGAR